MLLVIARVLFCNCLLHRLEALVNEQCGDGIMSAIDFYLDVGTTVACLHRHVTDGTNINCTGISEILGWCSCHRADAESDVLLSFHACLSCHGPVFPGWKEGRKACSYYNEWEVSSTC